MTFAGSRERTRLKRPWPAIVVQAFTTGINDEGVPNAVPETIRSSNGPSSAGSAMLTGVDAPLGVAERDRPRRLKKPTDFEEMAETAEIGVAGLLSTCCAAMLTREFWRDDGWEVVGVS